MRISDWSSDVCSSDLPRLTRRKDLAHDVRPYHVLPAENGETLHQILQFAYISRPMIFDPQTNGIFTQRLTVKAFIGGKFQEMARKQRHFIAPIPKEIGRATVR